MDDAALLTKFAFKIREVVEIMPRAFGFCRRQFLKGPALGNELPGKSEIIFHIGRNPQQPAWTKDSCTLSAKLCSQHTSFFVPPLPPGIREVHVYGATGTIGHIVAKELARVGSDEANVSQLSLGKPVGREQLVLSRDFDSKKIRTGLGRSRRNKEQAFPRTYFNFYWAIISEYLLP
jgi:hypothetical protein